MLIGCSTRGLIHFTRRLIIWLAALDTLGIKEIINSKGSYIRLGIYQRSFRYRVKNNNIYFINLSFIF
jgi:hypothetical protein